MPEFLRSLLAGLTPAQAAEVREWLVYTAGPDVPVQIADALPQARGTRRARERQVREEENSPRAAVRY